MLYNLLLAAEEGANKNGWVMWVIIAVVIVLMVVLTIIPQKKRQKEQQKMMSSLVVGTKLMTVGGLVGRVTQVNTDNTLIINVGTESTPTLIVIDRKAVGYVLENVATPATLGEATPAVEPAPATDTVVTDAPSAPEVEEVKEEEHDHIEDIHDYNGEESDMPEEKSSLSDLDNPF